MLACSRTSPSCLWNSVTLRTYLPTVVLWVPHHLGPNDFSDMCPPHHFSIYSLCLPIGPWILRAPLTSGPLYMLFQCPEDIFHWSSRGSQPPFREVPPPELPSPHILPETVHSICVCPLTCSIFFLKLILSEFVSCIQLSAHVCPLDCIPWVQGLCLVDSCIFSML